MRNILAISFIVISYSSNTQSLKTVEDFTLKDVRDNKEYSLSSFKNSKAFAIIFISTECPFSVHYNERVKALIEKYSGNGVSFLLINSNFGSSEFAESLDRLKLHARNFNAPYLADMAQDALAKFGARKNPEVFLLKPQNEKFVIVYQGAIDDNPQVQADVHTRYFENALEQYLANKPVKPAYVNPAGCIIKKR